MADEKDPRDKSRADRFVWHEDELEVIEDEEEVAEESEEETEQ